MINIFIIFTIFYLGADIKSLTNRAPTGAHYPGESKQPHKETSRDTKKGL